MKKLLLILVAAVSLSTVAVAQTNVEKGKIVFAADITEVNLTILQDFALGFGVGGGYFVMDNLCALASVNGNFNDQVSSFGVHIGAGYYIMPSTKGGFNVNAMFGVNTSKPKGGEGDTTFDLLFGAGYSFFLNEHVSLDPGVALVVPFKGDIQLGATLGFRIYF